jgi:hypothetical protein
MGRAQVVGHDEMVLNTYLLLLKCLLLPKLRAANHTTLSPPKPAFCKTLSLPYCSLQYASKNQQISLAFKAYLQKLIFDNPSYKFCFIVIHSISSHHSR